MEIGRTLVEALRAHRVRQLEQRLRLGSDLRNEHDLICCLEDGRYIQPGVLGLRFTRCLERLAGCGPAPRRGRPPPRLGGKGSFHWLRHAHVSLLIKAGVPINVISARVGHANPSITHNIYAHLLPGMNRMAADVFERLIEAKAIATG